MTGRTVSAAFHPSADFLVSGGQDRVNDLPLWVLVSVESILNCGLGTDDLVIICAPASSGILAASEHKLQKAWMTNIIDGGYRLGACIQRE